MRTLKNKSGFTLIELLIVAVIIMIIAAIVVPSCMVSGTENRIVLQMSSGTNPLSRQDWIYYKEHKQKLDNKVEEEKKKIVEKDKEDNDYQEYLKSFKR